MEVRRVQKTNLELYKDYCYLFRKEHDESELYDEDIEAFDPKIHPAYIALDGGKVIGAASLKVLPYLQNRTRGRFIILHVIEEYAQAEEAYRELLRSLEPHFSGLDHLFCFVPENKYRVRDILKMLGFELNRYVWVLVRDDLPVQLPELPQDLSLKAFEGEKDAEDWCHVRNEAFKTVKGSETPINLKEAMEMQEEPGFIEGGMMLLKKAGRAVGVIRVTHESEEGKEYAFISSIAVLPEFQQMGLGRMLLRAGLALGKEKGLPYGMLCVNAQNHQATKLYLSEGFMEQSVMICYRKGL